MNKSLYLLAVLIAIIQAVAGQDIPVPDSYSIVDTVTGDLDQDSIRELVVAYNAGPIDEFEGVARTLIVYKLQNNRWTEWKRSHEALYGSREGGMMVDPFGRIEIENGILVISQNGGSIWKWRLIDSYRFQDGDFYLIGHISNAGKLCEYWKEVDFNLITGELIVKKEYEECKAKEQIIYKRESETLVERGVEITLAARQGREIKIVTPKYGHEIYIAIGKQ